MLTSIEISGFKSFADKARIDFSEGISVIVGPNGSGKSNIVDAIKWVLGEQSVKKLRGSEMADVIFGGSKSRGPANMAEVTLSFNNQSRFFSFDADELHLTRRLYRNGESEYLINRQGVRLKDIRDLLTGSGLGSQAYSIIEQGRVGLLLQTTSQQRRAILEDAAGTSLFNAKSQEALRRLERVEQNLLRLSDIVGEVESQYKRTKVQAGKAQQYRQYAARLEKLRTEAALIEWRKSKARSLEIENESIQLEGERETCQVAVNEDESLRSEYVLRYDEVDQALRDVESSLADIREKAAGGESTVKFQLSQITQLEKEIDEQGNSLDSLKTQSGEMKEMMRRNADEILDVRRRHREIKTSFDGQTAELERLTAECDETRGYLDQWRAALQDQKVNRSRIAGEISGLENRLKSLRKTKHQREERHQELSQILSQFLETDSRFLDESNAVKSRLSETKSSLAKKKEGQGKLSETLESLNEESREMEQRLAAVRERLSLLNELVRSQEGLSPGVKEVLKQASDPSGPFRNVHGLVADLIRVSADAAPLIESALGQTAQYLVVSPDRELFSYLENHVSTFPGRAGFMWLSPPPEDGWNETGEFDGLPGVLGRADRFVETEPKFEFLVYRLLGRTWIVEDIKTAKQLYRRSDGFTDFITISGEALLSNGTLLVGPSHISDGQIMRRTEIRTLSAQVENLEESIASKKKEIDQAAEQMFQFDSEIKTGEEKIRITQKEADALRVKWDAHREQDKNSQIELDRLNTELEELEREEASILEELENGKSEKRGYEDKTAELENAIAEARGRFSRSDKFRKDASKQLTNLKIELAKSEERISSFSDRQKQLNDSLRDHHKLLKDHSVRLDALRLRRETSEMTILRSESALAEQAWRKERILTERSTLIEKREKASSNIRETDERLTENRNRLSQVRESLRLCEIERERIEQNMKNLADIMREDYGIDLPACAAGLAGGTDLSLIVSTESSSESTADSLPADRTSVGTLEECMKEIETLKGKIRRLGSVNLEALETLEHLETRYTTCSNQYKDLLAARQAIQKIIERTNQQRQKLFKETFEAVRIHFLNLFQQLFGGGSADVVFESPENPLESGIEIVARPPGKELKNVALLSGGEKTLTSVAFLLALFQYRSSPICILDEVDAALDEVNVDRFNAVIRDFKTDTQFLMITHSKKTMMIAKSLYGVTMQESGISKLIAVQFDEVGEDGEILVSDVKKQAA